MDTQHRRLSELEGIFNPVYRLMARHEGYGLDLIMTYVKTWTEVIVPMVEFCSPEMYRQPDDMDRFLSIAQSIVGFDPVIFFTTLSAQGMIDVDTIPALYATEMKTYRPLSANGNLADVDEEIAYLDADTNKILYFGGSSVVYTSLVFSLPDILDEEFFNQMVITDDVVRISYIHDEKRMYKQTTKLTREEMDIILSRKILTEQGEENGLLIIMSVDSATININVTRWYIEISSSKPVDIKPVVKKLNDDWGISIEYIFVFKAEYEMVIRDIQYEMMMYYWGLSKSKKYRGDIDVKEVSSQFWDKNKVTSHSLNLMVMPEQDKYSLMFTKGVSISASIFQGNAFVPRYQHQPDHMDRLLTMNLHGANEAHAKYIMFYLANSVKEIMSDWMVLAFELDQILLDRNGREVYNDYMKAYTKRLLGEKVKSAKRIFKLNNHNMRYLHEYYDTEIYSSYNDQCTSQSRPVISDPADYDVWTRAGFNTLIADNKLYICGAKKKMTEITISIADMSYTFYCCKGSKQAITHISDVKGAHSKFLHAKKYPVIRSLSDPMLFEFLGTWSNQATVSKMYIHIPDKFLLIHCIAYAMDIDNPFEAIQDSRLLRDKIVSIDLSGDTFVDHVNSAELLEEVFHVTLVVFELSDIVRRNRTLERPIIFVNCVRGSQGEPFYHLISFMYLDSQVVALQPGETLYNHFSPMITSLSITNKTDDGTTEPVKFMYIPSPRGYVPSVFLQLRKSNKVLVVTGQVLDTEGRRVISIVHLGPNNTYKGPAVEGLIYHAPSAPYPVGVRSNISRYIIRSDVWIAHDVSPSFVSRYSIIEENEDARYVFVCDVDDSLMDKYPNVDDPKFITNQNDTDEVDMMIENIKQVESMNRLVLNLIAQAVLLVDNLWDVVVFVPGLSVVSWTRDYYRLVDTVDELLEVVESCLVCYVDGELHSPTATGLIVVDNTLVEDVYYFVSFIKSRKNFSDTKKTQSLSPNADKFFFETDYTQSDDTLTFINQFNLWKYSDSLLVDDDMATVYISPYLSMRESPYRLKIGDDVFIAYNVKNDQEAEWVIDYYYRLGDIPERNDIINVKLSKERESEYVKYRISNSGNTKVAVPTENVDKKIYKILYYPVHYTMYRQAALLIS